MTTTRDLIDAIESGDTIEIESTFQSVMSQKAGDALGERRQEIAMNFFNKRHEVESDDEPI